MPQRGIRQGDPISPYLFLLITEGLSAMLNKECMKGDIQGLVVCKGAPAISHLLFADDCFVFFRANEKEATILRDIIRDYAQATGQLINFDKSSLCFSKNSDQSDKELTGCILGVQTEDTSGRYLGLHSMVGRKKKEVLGFLKDKIMTRIKSWNNRFLSKAGSKILFKNVIQAMPTYAMMVFVLPKRMCNEIEIVMNNY